MKHPIAETVKTFSLDDLNMETGGACTACGDIVQDGIEPDARNYRCPNCGEPKMFGSEELLIMGLVE